MNVLSLFKKYSDRDIELSTIDLSDPDAVIRANFIGDVCNQLKIINGSEGAVVEPFILTASVICDGVVTNNISYKSDDGPLKSLQFFHDAVLMTKANAERFYLEVMGVTQSC